MVYKLQKFTNRALHDIYNELEELPSLHKETSKVTNAGQREYDLPTAIHHNLEIYNGVK